MTQAMLFLVFHAACPLLPHFPIRNQAPTPNAARMPPAEEGHPPRSSSAFGPCWQLDARPCHEGACGTGERQ
jgi:hypothetical protein